MAETTDTVARFAVIVDADASSADNAADQLDRLRKQIEGDRKALGGMRAALGAMKGDTIGAADSIKKLQDEIAIRKVVVAQSQAEYIALGGSFEAAARGAAGLNAAKPTIDTAAFEAAHKALEGLSLNQVKDKLAADTKALGELEGAFRRLGGDAAPATATLAKLRSEISAHKASVAAAQDKYLGLGGSLSALTDKIPEHPIKKFGSALSELGPAADVLPGPAGNVIRSLDGMRALLTTGGVVVGFVALAAAVLGVTAAFVAGYASLAKYALAMSGLRRDEELSLAAIGATTAALRKTPESALNDLPELFDEIAQGSATSRDQIAKMGTELLKAGVTGHNLDEALNAAATKAAVFGDSAGDAFVKTAIAANGTAGGIDRLAAKVDAQLGGLAQEKLLGLDVQLAKVKEGFASIFGGLRITGFLRNLKQVTDLFSQNTASARALRTLFQSLFSPFESDSKTAGLAVRRFFQGMIIGALQLGIWFQKLRIKYNETFGDSKFLADLDSAKVALFLGKAAVVGLTVAFGLAAAAIVGVAAVLGTIALSAAAVVAPVVALGAVVWGVANVVSDGIKWMVDQFQWLIANIKDLSWSDVGNGILDGLLEPFRNPKKVLDAVVGLGKSMITSFKSSLGIASPSKVFAAATDMTTEGSVQSFRRGKPKVQQAARELAPPANVLEKSFERSGEFAGFRFSASARASVKRSSLVPSTQQAAPQRPFRPLLAPFPRPLPQRQQSAPAERYRPPAIPRATQLGAPSISVDAPAIAPPARSPAQPPAASRGASDSGRSIRVGDVYVSIGGDASKEISPGQAKAHATSIRDELIGLLRASNFKAGAP
jgi:hypothetical protein